MNVAVKKLRRALLDSATEPRYIETIPGEGYRFIAPLEEAASPASAYDCNVELGTRPGDCARTAPAELASAPSPDLRRFSPLWGIGLAVALALVTAGSHFSRQALPFHERDWVLIDGFENRTGEALFDGTLRAALERELSNSEFVNVAPRERVEDALLLMKRPPEATLNASQAREVCLRDGGIRALVTGRTERLGSTYLVSAEVIDPFQNRSLASDTETALGQDQIWPAVRRLSNWVRETLGETMERIDRSNRQLERVTTPSLGALQLFTEADSASRLQQWAVAAQLLRQALVEDPGFVSAHLWLAFALCNIHDEQWKAEAEKALALSGTVSESERYFILGSYEVLTGHPDRALPPLEALVRRYPDHYFASKNLTELYRTLGHIQQAGEIAARFADMRPNDPSANAAAAFWNQSIDLARARPYARRAAELGGTSAGFDFQVNTLFFHAHDLWMQDDVNGALAELQRIAANPKDWSNASLRPLVSSALASIYLTLGRFQTSEEWFDSLVTDTPSSLGTDPFDPRMLVSFLKADMGDPKPTILSPDWQRRNPKMPLVRYEVLITQGRFAESAALMQPAFIASYRRGAPAANLQADRLVTSLERSGNAQKALPILEATSATRLWISPGNPAYGAFWLRNQARLSAYYHRLGREQEARKIDSQLRKLLAVADPDHPILRQLNGR